jgi:hypothetical protein
MDKIYWWTKVKNKPTCNLELIKYFVENKIDFEATVSGVSKGVFSNNIQLIVTAPFNFKELTSTTIRISANKIVATCGLKSFNTDYYYFTLDETKKVVEL